MSQRTTKKERLITATLQIIQQYTTRLTVRQIYYRLVSAHIIRNTVGEYQYLVGVLADARREGIVPYGAIEDRTRNFVGGDEAFITEDAHFNRGLAYLRNLPDYYDLPRWQNQPHYVEIWLEKQALAGVFTQALQGLGVTLAPCRGYPSLTFLWEAANRLEQIGDERDIQILYFGDYDPSGMDIERAIVDELIDNFGLGIDEERIAITRQQIQQYNIPPMPAKRTDSRAAGFIAEHGDVAVELDALDPEVLIRLIREAVAEYFDEEIHTETLEEQEETRERLRERVEGLNLPEG